MAEAVSNSAAESPSDAAFNVIPASGQPANESPRLPTYCWLCKRVAALVDAGIYTCPICNHLETLGV